MNRFLPSRALTVLAAALCATPALQADTIDFEGLPAGTILSSLNTSGGAGPILVHGHNPSLGAPNAAVIFDSSNPTGGDSDLGSPHFSFGGPGFGAGGALGQPYANSTALGKILIVDEHLVVGGNGLVTDPDDAAVLGQTLDFDFSAVGTVTLRTCTYIDIETTRPDGQVEMFDGADNLLAAVSLVPVGDNGVNTLSLGDVAGVDHMRVTLNGSGAIAGFELDVDCTASLGDLVWNDLDGDGLQDAGEPGVGGVTVLLFDANGGPLGSTQTLGDGSYAFTALCPGTYGVALDPQTLPEGFVQSPCGVGNDSALDSDCQPAPVTLGAGQHDPTVDFGLKPIPFVNCHSLPNSTGQVAGASGSGSTSIADNQFSVTFTNLPPHQPAYLFYGTNGVNVPFGSGVQCIGSPIVRYRKVPDIDPSGVATIPLDFASSPMNVGFGQVVPGVPFYFQLWYRDPGNTPSFNMTDSLCVTFAP